MTCRSEIYPFTAVVLWLFLTAGIQFFGYYTMIEHGHSLRNISANLYHPLFLGLLSAHWLLLLFCTVRAICAIRQRMAANTATNLLAVFLMVVSTSLFIFYIVILFDVVNILMVHTDPPVITLWYFYLLFAGAAYLLMALLIGGVLYCCLSPKATSMQAALPVAVPSNLSGTNGKWEMLEQIQGQRRLPFLEEMRQGSCAICLENYWPPSELLQGGCGHSFHWKCLQTWVCKSQFPPSCPLCRWNLLASPLPASIP